MIMWTGLAPWEFEFPVPGSLTSIFNSRTGDSRHRAVQLPSDDSALDVPARDGHGEHHDLQTLREGTTKRVLF